MTKILVVDDEDNIRLLYKEELQDEGYEVSLAANAEEALKVIETEKPDLITWAQQRQECGAVGGLKHLHCPDALAGSENEEQP